MANKSKAKGTRAETKVVRYLGSFGIEAQRRALTGSLDTGDVEYITRQGKKILEVKAGKMTQSYSRGDKSTWLAQARAEAENSGMECRLVIARHGRSEKDYEVWSADGHSFMYLDEFAKQIGEGK